MKTFFSKKKFWLNLNVKIPEDQVIKIEDEKKLNEKNAEIRELIKNFKEPDLMLHIENTEATKIKIPFTKKSETDLPLIKYSYFDTITKKTQKTYLSTISLGISKNMALNGDGITHLLVLDI